MGQAARVVVDLGEKVADPLDLGVKKINPTSPGGKLDPVNMMSRGTDPNPSEPVEHLNQLTADEKRIGAEKAGEQQKKKSIAAQGRTDRLKTGPRGLGEVGGGTEPKRLLGY
jgi:hypothetical protein